MVEEANKKTSADGRTTFKDLKGRKVYDADGEVLGHVSDIEINLTTLNPTKLIIHKGFFGKYLRINIKYIEEITEEHIKLWISPARNLVGTKVLDINDDEIGIVKEAQKGKEGELEYIDVETRLLKTRNGEEEVETYPVPMISFDDMSISLPPAAFEEEPAPTHMDFNRKKLHIEAEEIVDAGKECIRLNDKKEKYLDIKD
ncbi:MAG: PRC-barrel domain-containing protein [Candidatus Thermoplasmatota archaeon]|nr:PRC-barrel domain-containing protein [Candidatus Thermoplasmatota archaeon]